MWIVILFCMVAIAFLLACLRNFHTAVRQKHTVWAVLINTKKNNVTELPRHKQSPGKLPKAA